MRSTLLRLRTVALLLLALFLCGTIYGAGVPRTDVFVSGVDGYNTYRIPAMVVTTNDTVLAFCEGRKNGHGDAGKIDIVMKRSTVRDSEWSKQQVVWSDGDNSCSNPTPVVDAETGYIWLLLTWNLGSDHEKDIEKGSSKDTRRVFVTVSRDDGLTWAKPKEITSSVKKPAWGWYATGPGNGIQLTHKPRGGRLVIPANHSEINKDGHAVTRSHVFFSDDHGKTWQLGGSEDEMTNESTVVELVDGSLLQNMRSNNGKNRRMIANSKDGGMTWTPAKLDEALIEPVCQGSMLRWWWPLKGNNGRILFCNPASTNRENLTVRMSFTEGATWALSRVIYPGPSGYSCMAIFPDRNIWCLFECGEKKFYERISLAQVAAEPGKK